MLVKFISSKTKLDNMIPILQEQSLQRKPDWFKVKPVSNNYSDVRQIIKENKLVTVCEESMCPNISECWSGGTATFMVLGDTCTRGCRFCNVKTGAKGKEVDKDEPKKIANVVKEWNERDRNKRIFGEEKNGLNYIVITSVDRDDLEDQGSNHFAEVIREVKKQNPQILVEVLIPDFRGNINLLRNVVEAKPDVIAHNVETVRDLQRKVRDVRANFDQSLSILRGVKLLCDEMNFGLDMNDIDYHKILTKTSIMLGLGETDEQVESALNEIRESDVDVITFGQYLKPSSWHLDVIEYVHPDKFKYFEEVAMSKGFLYCASGPLVRSSYKAGEYFIANLVRQNEKESKTEESEKEFVKSF